MNAIVKLPNCKMETGGYFQNEALLCVLKTGAEFCYYETEFGHQ
jgi:hypothetical protein